MKKIPNKLIILLTTLITVSASQCFYVNKLTAVDDEASLGVFDTPLENTSDVSKGDFYSKNNDFLNNALKESHLDGLNMNKIDIIIESIEEGMPELQDSKLEAAKAIAENLKT